jgi:hypothetical protein
VVQTFNDNITSCIKEYIKLVKKITDWNRKGKAIPLQALTGPEGSRMLRLPDFKTIGT